MTCIKQHSLKLKLTFSLLLHFKSFHTFYSHNTAHFHLTPAQLNVTTLYGTLVESLM